MPPSASRQRLDDRLQAHRALGLALRPAEMGQHDDLGPLARPAPRASAHARSMRVASVTSPFCIGTLKSTRTRTRLPFERRRHRASGTRAWICLLSRGGANIHPLGCPQPPAWQTRIGPAGICDRYLPRCGGFLRPGGKRGRRRLARRAGSGTICARVRRQWRRRRGAAAPYAQDLQEIGVRAIRHAQAEDATFEWSMESVGSGPCTRPRGRQSRQLTICGPSRRLTAFRPGREEHDVPRHRTTNCGGKSSASEGTSRIVRWASACMAYLRLGRERMREARRANCHSMSSAESGCLGASS